MRKLFLAVALLAACDIPVRFTTGAECDVEGQSGTVTDVVRIARERNGYRIDIRPRSDGLAAIRLSYERWLFTVIPDVAADKPIFAVLKTEARESGCFRAADFHVHALAEVE